MARSRSKFTGGEFLRHQIIFPRSACRTTPGLRPRDLFALKATLPNPAEPEPNRGLRMEGAGGICFSLSALPNVLQEDSITPFLVRQFSSLEHHSPTVAVPFVSRMHNESTCFA